MAVPDLSKLYARRIAAVRDRGSAITVERETQIMRAAILIAAAWARAGMEYTAEYANRFKRSAEHWSVDTLERYTAVGHMPGEPVRNDFGPDIAPLMGHVLELARLAYQGDAEAIEAYVCAPGLNFRDIVVDELDYMRYDTPARIDVMGDRLHITWQSGAQNSVVHADVRGEIEVGVELAVITDSFVGPGNVRGLVNPVSGEIHLYTGRDESMVEAATTRHEWLSGVRREYAANGDEHPGRVALAEPAFEVRAQFVRRNHRSFYIEFGRAELQIIRAANALLDRMRAGMDSSEVQTWLDQQTVADDVARALQVDHIDEESVLADVVQLAKLAFEGSRNEVVTYVSTTMHLAHLETRASTVSL